jgi:hypothetical protein
MDGNRLLKKGVETMAYTMYEDNNGNYLMPEEVEEMSPWEIEERGIHIASIY